MQLPSRQNPSVPSRPIQKRRRNACGNGITATLCLILAGLFALSSGCRSPQKKIDRQLSNLRLEWHTNIQHQANLPERQIDWPAAVALMRNNNLKLIQSRIDVTNSQEAVRQIFRDLVPSLNLRAGVSKKLESLNTTSIDDVTFSADSFFNIPGLISFNARLYTTRLFLIRSQTAAALAERQQMIELYKLFLAAQDTLTDLEHISTQRETARAFGEVDPFTGQMMTTELELKEIALRKDLDTVQQRAADLLGDYSHRWVLLTNNLPELNYHLTPLPLDDTNRVAQLQLRLVAVELEAAQAQLLGIKLRYWPELNLFVSGPPLYQRAFGRERFWDASEIRASADLFWYVDTRGQVARQVRQAKRQQALQRERYRQEELALQDKLLFTQSILNNTLEKARQVDAQIEIMRTVPPAQNYLSLRKYAEDYQALIDKQRALRRELAELMTLFWFVDEYAWPQPISVAAANSNPTTMTQ
ncbi:MAG: hypothetical protein AB1813_03645 [Verrucomicrobiota bacterium]